jgi:A/G-specific adenine glycosylase
VRRVCERAGARPAVSPGRGGELNQALMELGATVCRARSAACPACPLTSSCASAAAGGPAIAPRARAGAGERFQDTDRYVRGRVVAALLERAPLPPGAERVLSGLERDGLIVRDPSGTARLPASRMAAADFDLVREDPSGP